MSDKPAKPGHVSEHSVSVKASVFKATCLELMDDVAANGGEIVVTKYGKPVVKVTRTDAVSSSPVGFLRNTVIHADDLVLADHDAWLESGSDPLDGKVK